MGSELRGLLSMAPPNTELAVLLDLQRLVRGPLWKERGATFERGLRARPEYVDLAAATGIDPLRDIRGLALFVSDLSERPAASLLAVRVRVEEKKLRAYLKTRSVETKGLFLLESGYFLAFAPDTLWIGDPGPVAAAKQGAQAPAKLSSLLQSLDPGRPLTFAASLSAKAQARMALPLEMESLEGLAGWLDLSAGLEGKLLLHFASAEGALRMKADLDRTWEKASKRRSRDSADVWRDLRWEVQKNDLAFAWTLPAGEAQTFMTTTFAFEVLQALGTLQGAIAAQQAASQPGSQTSPGSAPASAP
jgi:hypothetical protein